MKYLISVSLTFIAFVFVLLSASCSRQIEHSSSHAILLSEAVLSKDLSSCHDVRLEPKAHLDSITLTIGDSIDTSISPEDNEPSSLPSRRATKISPAKYAQISAASSTSSSSQGSSQGLPSSIKIFHLSDSYSSQIGGGLRIVFYLLLFLLLLMAWIGIGFFGIAIAEIINGTWFPYLMALIGLAGLFVFFTGAFFITKIIRRLFGV